jgi:hypothetical protein
LLRRAPEFQIVNSTGLLWPRILSGGLTLGAVPVVHYSEVAGHDASLPLWLARLFLGLADLFAGIARKLVPPELCR